VHYVKYKKWWDTKSFQQAGKSWLENDYYCPFPSTSKAYDEYWDEQTHIIQNGMVHDGQRITGLHYLYLNYCPIKVKKVRKLTLPDFWVVDADYFEHLEYCLGYTPGMTQEEIWERPIVFSASKSRQTGASLKGMVPVLYNMNFVPFSQNYIGAYLNKDAVKSLQMYLKYQNHAFKYTDWGKRYIKKDADKQYKIGYFETVDKEKIEAGYQSELHIVSFQDNAEKGVGGGCDLFILEEAGMHPNLLQSVTYITPACKDGDYTTGNILVYGAAGPEGQCDDLKKLHYNPRSYKAMAFVNEFDSKPIEDECGYFIPNYSCRGGHMDKDGNPNCETAIVARDKDLAELKSKDIEQYLETLSQYPNDGSEMFGARGRKRYDSHIIEQQISLLRKAGVQGDAVDLYEDINTGKIKRVLSSRTPIRMWPTPPGTDTNGAIEIFEDPGIDIPDGLYIAAIDSYNQDDATTTSLGCIQIFKRINNISSEGTNRVLVAEYLARPTGPFGKHDFYRNCVRLLKYYNAVALPENEDHELTPWFYTNNFEHLLADQPDIIRSIIPGSNVKRLKGIHAVPQLIAAAENKIQRYLYEPIGKVYDSDGNIISEKLGVSRIPSLGTLYELLNYSTEGNKNFDRVRTFGWLLLYEEETINNPIQEKYEESTVDFLVNTKRFHKKKPQYGFAM
jgi:hypothetical protein